MFVPGNDEHLLPPQELGLINIAEKPIVGAGHHVPSILHSNTFGLRGKYGNYL